MTLIGYDGHTPVTIGDTERRSGLYILGRPGMGKSTLLVNLALQDAENGHGVFFLDPHGDAIRDFVRRVKSAEERPLYIFLLNPTDDTYSIGMNPLWCDDVDNRQKRTDAYTRTYNVFKRIWENGVCGFSGSFQTPSMFSLKIRGIRSPKCPSF